LFSLVLTVADDQRDELIADLWESGTAGITEEDGWIRAFFDEPAAPEEVAARFAGFKPELIHDEQTDWVKHSQDQWQPLPVGETFYLVPDWRHDAPPQGRKRLTIHAGMAAGSGMHPATQLCLRALEQHARNRRVLDVGTGSGILAEGALLAGASTVFACDIDHQATLIARNNVAASGVLLFTGSVRSARTASVDTVVANLNAATIQTMSSDLRRVVRPHGRMILAGFREDEEKRIASLIQLETMARLEQDGWSCLVFAGASS
jgi:ribosomal protein L11 methyltransferase